MISRTLKELDTAQRFRLMTTLVAPRPIALTSTVSQEGIGNLAPFSYFTIGGSNPSSCVIVPINNREGMPKDSINNIRATGEYVINIVTAAIVDEVVQSSFAYPPEVDEFDEVGLTRLDSELVKPPRVAESPIQLECRKFQVVDHGSGPLASSYVIGEVLRVHMAESIMTDGKPDNQKIDHIGRLGGIYYTKVSGDNLFEVERPG